MFQTNITPPPPNALSRSNALRRGMCVFARAFWESDEGGNRKRASVFWVCLKASGLVSETVFPVCHGLKGLLLLFSSHVFSVSPSPPGSSSTPAPCSRHGEGRAGVPKQLKATRVLHTQSLFPSLSSSIILQTCSFHPKRKAEDTEMNSIQTFCVSIFFFFFF